MLGAPVKPDMHGEGGLDKKRLYSLSEGGYELLAQLKPMGERGLKKPKYVSTNKRFANIG